MRHEKGAAGSVGLEVPVSALHRRAGRNRCEEMVGSRTEWLVLLSEVFWCSQHLGSGRTSRLAELNSSFNAKLGF